MTSIQKSYRVRIVNLELNIAYACNLKCEFCTHLGRFMKGIVPMEELLFWYQSWNKKILPQNVRIMGGEPLLHPQLADILQETRNHWHDSQIELITNGLLLPKANAAIFTALKEIDAYVTLSKHFDDPYYNSMFESGIEVLREHGIEPRITRSNWFWMKCYRFDEQGYASPYQSDPKKAWEICYVKNMCTTLLDNHLYRCPQLACYSHAVRKGFVSDDWKIVLGYQPLTPSCTQEELEEFIQNGSCEQCSICPEEFQYADMYEKINVFGLPVTKNIFCGGTNNE